MKLKRQEVYNILDKEREYQDTIRKERENDQIPDDQKSIADFTIFIENKLNKTKDSVYKLNNEEALDNIRKIAALSVACLEQFGCPERK